MKEFLRLLIATVVLGLVIVRTFDLAVLPPAVEDLINVYVGYVLAHLIIDFQRWRAERRKVRA